MKRHDDLGARGHPSSVPHSRPAPGLCHSLYQKAN
jgi:hypothetical protein